MENWLEADLDAWKRDDPDSNLYAVAAATKRVKDSKGDRPSLNYLPGRLEDLDGNPIDPRDNGQLQFHMAPHEIRSCAPGNGWGKTQVSAIEVDWCGFGDHPWPHDLPVGRPRQMIWVAKKMQQWELLKKVVHPWWPKCVTDSWRGQPFNDYTWPDGSKLVVVSDQTDRTTLAGIEPDLVIADEEFDVRVANELRMRRRGKTRTRFVFNGTATEGLTWVHSQIYVPWKKHHERLGITDQREMMRVQSHTFGDIDAELAGFPGIWCWPMGSHADNPTATRETWARYKATTAKFSEAERFVRLYGGYRDFNGQPVFNRDALEKMRAKLAPGESGWFVEEKPEPAGKQIIGGTPIARMR